ncbi:unnamed protein product [Mytilus edulis]|uniref:Uncharacterized protein n=1 Tax=Mytilus edulis TaxID=6550 RepID=A0A8S3QBJ3_MYTED|nr:unnamed protein product [Mytilus edulis]
MTKRLRYSTHTFYNSYRYSWTYYKRQHKRIKRSEPIKRLDKDDKTRPINLTTPKDVPGPIKNDKTKENKVRNKSGLDKDDKTRPINSTTPKDVPGPIKNDKTKETKVRNKSGLDKDDKELKQSHHRRDVVLQRSHTLAPGKQNYDGGHINQRVQRRSQYNRRPENSTAYYYDRPVMPYGEAWWPHVGHYPYQFGYDRQRWPDEYYHQRGNTFSWSSDC